MRERRVRPPWSRSPRRFRSNALEKEETVQPIEVDPRRVGRGRLDKPYSYVVSQIAMRQRAMPSVVLSSSLLFSKRIGVEPGCAFCRTLYPQGRQRARPPLRPRRPCGCNRGGRTAGEATATEFVSKGWIGRRGGLQGRFNRGSDRDFGSAGDAQGSSIEGTAEARGPR
jgi:hypothetical protein